MMSQSCVPKNYNSDFLNTVTDDDHLLAKHVHSKHERDGDYCREKKKVCDISFLFSFLFYVFVSLTGWKIKKNK